ncbi:MAG: protein kinase [Planctomycetes bacterium]|nr:protein kinase [Planctomycetota bacterium]
MVVPGLAGKCADFPTLVAEVSALRYAIRGELGTGSTGVVLAATDTSLRRDIAIKFLGHGELTGPKAERLLHEARVAASLEHPAIVPLYDLDRSPAGDLYLTMKRARGRSLGVVLAEAATGIVPTEIPTAFASIDIVLRVCDGVAAAHARDVIHRDIKPDNIVVGSFGEVVLVDWGLASDLGSVGTNGTVVGTPLYMSPEQARGGAPTRGDDIYALGATLFHLLHHRPPLRASADVDGFWRAKRAGAIDPPTAEERQRVPARLGAIALRAIDADPARRYASVVDLAADLRAYLAGLSVSAYVDPWIVRASAWLRRHAKAIATMATIVALLAAIVAMIWRDRLQEIARWGSPTFVENPSGGWRDRWVTANGSFEEQAGALVSRGMSDSTMFLRQRMVGEIAVEFTGRMLGSSPCDLSLVYTTDLRLDERGVPRPDSMWQFKFGAFDATTTQILGPNSELLSSARTVPVPDQDYRVRMELCQDRVALLVDGVVVCSATPPILPTAGHIGLYAYYPGKSFRDIRIFAKGLPARPRATVVGDVLFTQGRFADAIEQFERVLDTHAGSDLGDEAAYKRALCLRRLGRHQEAAAARLSLAGTAWETMVIFEEVDELIDQDRPREALALVRSLARHPEGNVRQRAALAWSSLVSRHLAGTKDEALLEAAFATQQECFPDDEAARGSAAVILAQLGRFEELLERFPDSHQSAWELRRQGRYDEGLERFPRFSSYVAEVLIDSGRAPEAYLRFRDNAALAAMALTEMGRPEEALAICPDGPKTDLPRLQLGRLADVAATTTSGEMRDRARIFSGYAGAVALEPDAPLLADAMIVLDRVEEVAGRFPASRGAGYQAAQILALRTFIAGEHAAGIAAFSAACEGQSLTEYWSGTPQHILGPFLRRCSGDAQAWSQALDRAKRTLRHRFQGRVWHAAAYLSGDIDARAFLAQPNACYAAADLLLWRAMAAEIAGDAGSACAAYRAWLDTPEHQRGFEIDRLWPTFAQWRLGVLAR